MFISKPSFLILITLLLCFTGSNLRAFSPPQKPILKVGFVLQGSASDLDWSQAHEQGRQYVNNILKGTVETVVAENVPESAEVERVMEKMVAQGAKLIFSTAFGYLEPVLRVAVRHPEVIFMQCERSSPVSAKNVGSYYAIDYPPLYVAGVVAGRITRKSKLGFIASQPVPSVVTSINAFTLGVRSVKPQAKVRVIWTNSWCDPIAEAEATKGLIESGADVVASTSSATAIKTCEKHGVYSIGCNVDNSALAPKGWLTGHCWNWGPLYVKIIQSLEGHTWKKANTVYPLKDGYVCLASFGKAVPPAVKNEATALFKKIANGQVVIFKGPIKDCKGCERLSTGQILDADALKEVDWLVEGVEGAKPKG